MLERTSTASQTEPATRLVGSDRVLAVLTELAQQPSGISLDELAGIVESPKPTVHRALAALRRAGFATQDGRGHYVLGDEFLRLAFTNHEARPEHVRVQPILERLAALFNETVHYAVLDGRSVVYRAKVDPAEGAIKLTSVVGGRNPAHCTAVGKLLLSHLLPDQQALDRWISGGPPLERPTEHSKTDSGVLARELELIRERCYATESQENEIGISCLAVPVFGTSNSLPTGAISISALDYRTPLVRLVAGLPQIRAIVGPVSGQVAS